jgi:hypothetical protein
MLCRHKWSWSNGDDDFEDIAMIIHNRKNGETCWFQTDDSRGIKLDGRAVPGPETVRNHSFWLRPIETASVGCVGCHDNGPFMNSRWMNNAIDLADAEDEPYKNSEPPFDRWPVPRFAKSDQAAACQGCHKIAAGGRHLVAFDPADPTATIPIEFQTCADCKAICAAMPGTERCRRCRGWIQRATGGTSPATHPKGANAKALSDEVALWMPDLGTHTRADWNKNYAAAVDGLLKCCAEVGATKPGDKPKLAGCSEFAPKISSAIAALGGGEDLGKAHEIAHQAGQEDIYAALDASFGTREVEVRTRDASPAPASPAPVALPLDTDPLPPALAASGRESLASVKRKLAGFPKDERVACFVKQLEREDADDRVIPWTRICPAQGPDAPVCRSTSVGEAAIARIGSPEQVDAANAGITTGRKFIVHLRSDILRKDATQPASVYEKPNQALMVHHLKQLARDVALADTRLAAGAASAPGYAAIKGWIDQRKQDPKSVYACAGSAAAKTSTATPGCKWTSMDVIDPRIDDGAQQSLMRKLRLSSPAEIRAEGSAMLGAVKNESLAGILKPFRPAVAARAQKLGKTGDQLVPAGQDSICVTEPAGDKPLIVYRTGLDDARVDRALSDAWKQCGLPTPLPPCDYEVVLKPQDERECTHDYDCSDKHLGWRCDEGKCVECLENKDCVEQNKGDTCTAEKICKGEIRKGEPLPDCQQCDPVAERIEGLRVCPAGTRCSDSTHCCIKIGGDQEQCLDKAVRTWRAANKACTDTEEKEIEECTKASLECSVSTAAGEPDAEACAKATCMVPGTPNNPKTRGDACRKKVYDEEQAEIQKCGGVH